MDQAAFFLVIFALKTASCTSFFNQVYVANRDEPVRWGSIPLPKWLDRQNPYKTDDENQQYNQELYDLYTSDKLQSLMKNSIDWQLENEAMQNDPLRFDSDQENPKIPNGESIDYNDVYDIASLFNDLHPMEQKPTKKDPNHSNSDENDKHEKENQEKVANPIRNAFPDKKDIPISSVIINPSMLSSTTGSVSTFDTLSGTTSLSSTTSTASTIDEDDEAMPPVHVGKGQKEYPMLRPASESNRKLDNWADSIRNNRITIDSSSRQVRAIILPKDFTGDPVAEQLDQLKM